MVKTIALWGFILVLSAAALPSTAAAQSDDKTYVQFNTAHTFADILKQAMELKVRITLHLRSGIELGGRVAEVSTHNVVLKGLTQRDFYDAMVRIDEIAAIEARARDN